MTRPRAVPIDWAGLKERLTRSAAALERGRDPAEVRAVLAARARALAVPPPRARAGGAPVVVFRLGAERYALPTALIREVVRSPRVARLPGAPGFLVGIGNVRGEVVDVLDLRALLGAARAEPDPALERLLLLGADRTELALRVDEVLALEAVEPAELRPAPDSPARLRPEYVRGLTPDGVALLEGAAILQDPRLVVDEAAHATLPEVN